MSNATDQVIAGKKLTEAINAASTPERVLELLHEAAGGSGFAVRDNDTVTAAQQARDASGRFAAVETKEDDQPRTFVKTEIINGKPLEFTASSALELEQMIHQAHQVAQALQESANEIETVVPRRPTNPVAQVELELRFKRGEISASEYLQQSGAVDEYLESRGVSVDELKAATERNLQTRWADATQQFLESTDWVGGSKNRDQIATVIGTLGLVDSPSVESLKTAYAYMKDKGLVFEPAPEAIEQRAVEAALNSNASPQEILEAWKENLQAQGHDENSINDAFVRSYSKSGSGLFGR